MEFRDEFGASIFAAKYAMHPGETWAQRVDHIVNDVCGGLMAAEEMTQLAEYMREFKFVPGGRYIYYGGRGAKFYNNCFLLKGEEDTREEWGAVFNRSASCLMTGGGIGIDYSVFRPEGAPLGRTGGQASGPLPMMKAVDGIGGSVMQGGSRRSAIYASLNWQHADAPGFLKAKDWRNIQVTKRLSVADVKEDNVEFHAPLEMTNTSLNYDDHFLARISRAELPETYMTNVRQALQTGEPGFSFNFGPKVRETLRNACTEVSSEDDSDVCNLGSVNWSQCHSIEEFSDVCRLGSMFLICGSTRADLPYEKVYQVREKNRRVGLGAMGMHEWLLTRGYNYAVSAEMHTWLRTYKEMSEVGANEMADRLSVSRPVAYRAIAPTGTIGILAGTTTGIEPLFAVAYKRRFLKGKKWHSTVHTDSVAKMLIEEYALDAERIETSLDLASDPERRLAFQADIQDYVDMAISSTINLPEWGGELNNEDYVKPFAGLLARYAPRLRGFTAYPDGARNGQPLTPVPYAEAKLMKPGALVEEANDICDITKGGTCGV